MNEFFTAFYDKLSTTSAVTSLLSGATAIYQGEAPSNASFDYVIMALQGGPGDEPTLPDRHVSLVFSIKGVSATSSNAAGAISAAIDAALHHVALSVSGWTVFWLARETPFRYDEHDPRGVAIHHAGAIYRIRAYQ